MYIWWEIIYFNKYLWYPPLNGKYILKCPHTETLEVASAYAVQNPQLINSLPL